MPNIIRNHYSVSLLAIILLSACAAQNDWPQLTDAVPDATERNRVIERAEPAPYEQVETINKFQTIEEAQNLLKELEILIQEEKQAYDSLKNVFVQTSDETKNDLWFELQLALTRISHTNSRLDNIIQHNGDDLSSLAGTAKTIKSTTDKFVINERQTLAKLRPE
ncbi:hypothetical protein [Kordiimonas sp. SCSIO 12610]|uniref:hypothetical protein n=1 Tax=Kordiimonas sp. SCSIO 12610 TaxID=2829597 RepID=UPI00210D3874|nr:hypothetical protein [Kordiimonas sp. SCSIO 12610]UTW55362.1 hypothetical protein KFF44_00270 [Kordiimonas sp. SCSIO 12610]